MKYIRGARLRKRPGAYQQNGLLLPPPLDTEQRGGGARRGRPVGFLPAAPVRGGGQETGENGEGEEGILTPHSPWAIGLGGGGSAAGRGRRRRYWWRRGGAWETGLGRLAFGAVRRDGGGAGLK
jgi:hypothetical protein